jgi:soluble cytochrome b562
MKIYKIAQNKTFQMIPQNPTGQTDPNVQLQNLQNSQQALQALNDIMTTVNELGAKIADVDAALGSDTGLRAIIMQRVNQAIMQTQAYQMLSKMGILADANILSDPNKMSQIQVQLQRNITDYTSGLNQTQTGTQGALKGMGYQ